MFDLSQFSSLGAGTAVAVAVIAVFIWLLRYWKRNDELKEERHELLAKYSKAIDDRDLDLAGAIANRLREIEALLK